MEDLEYVCVLIHGEECVNNNDCKNCDYGVDESFFQKINSQFSNNRRD